MDVFDAIEKRASIRSFKNEQITEGELRAILGAAERAPRIGRLDILVLQNRQKIKELSDAARRAMIVSGGWNSARAQTPGYQPLYEAPTVIVGYTDDPTKHEMKGAAKNSVRILK